MGLLKARGKKRTDSTRILAIVCGLNRLELVGETMHHALDIFSTIAPEWLLQHINPEWVTRYVRRLDDRRLPKSKEDRQAEAERIGADGYGASRHRPLRGSPSLVARDPAVEVLRRVWLQNHFCDQDGTVRWRTVEEGIPHTANCVNHPIDTDTRYTRKFTTSWVGYRVHITEPCEDDLPNIITDVQTTPAPVAYSDATALIHKTLKEKELLPETQFVYTSYLDAELFSALR